jgi:hypothetical protein
METLKRVEDLCTEFQLTYQEVASKARLDEQVVLAIVLGRWTPSPEERDQIAAVFGRTRQEILWGHKTPVQHLYGQGPT